VKKQLNINFLKYRYACFIGSIAIILLGVIFFVIRGGFNLGLDFQGGIDAIIAIESEENIQVEDIKALLGNDFQGMQVAAKKDKNTFEFIYKNSDIEKSNALKTEALKTEATTDTTTDTNKTISSKEVTISQLIGGKILPILRERYGNGFVVRYIGKEENTTDIVSIIEATSKQIIENTENNVDKLKFELRETKEQDKNKLIFVPIEMSEGYKVEDFVSVIKNDEELGNIEKYDVSEIVYSIQVDSFEPTVGNDLQQVAFWVSSLIAILMLGYLALRFQFKFGVGAVIALVHDICVMLAAMAITNFELGIQTIVAILTIIGYSVNDTIVIFDRIRENSKNIKKEEYLFVINKSINQSFARTMLTSITTLFTVLALLIFGGRAVFELSFALVVGIISGTYSSDFIASPILLLWENSAHRRLSMDRKEKGIRFIISIIALAIVAVGMTLLVLFVKMDARFWVLIVIGMIAFIFIVEILLKRAIFGFKKTEDIMKNPPKKETTVNDKKNKKSKKDEDEEDYEGEV